MHIKRLRITHLIKEYKMRSLILSLVGLTTLTLLSLPAFADYGQLTKTRCEKIISRTDRSKKVVPSNEEEKGHEISSSLVISE